MTRETKVGLVVSCSFMCLVGTVVYVKYTQGDLPSRSNPANADIATLTIPSDPAPATPTANAVVASPSGDDGKTSPDQSVPPYAPPSLMDPNIQRAASAENRPAADTSPAPAFTETIPTPTAPAGSALDRTAKDTVGDDNQPPAPTWEATGTPRAGNDQNRMPAFNAPNGNMGTATPPRGSTTAGNPPFFPSPPPPESGSGTKTEPAPGFKQEPTFAPLPEPENTAPEETKSGVTKETPPSVSPASPSPIPGCCPVGRSPR